MSAAYSSYVDQPGLLGALSAAGLSPRYVGTTLYVSDLAAAQAFVASYNPLPATQAQAIAQVGAIYLEKIAAGFTYNGVVVGCDETTQGDIDRLSSIASNIAAGRISSAWPSTRQISAMPGQTGGVPVGTPAAMLAFGGAYGTYIADLRFYADSLIGQIQAAATASAVQSIDLTTGWPTS